MKIKRILSVVLVLFLCLTMIPAINVTSEAASTGLSLAQLREKFPHGKYWNHAGNPGSSNSVNNQNGYTSTPCSQHGVVGTSKQTCNGFQPGSSQLSWQCMGYAEKLGYDATGYNPRNNANGWYTYTSSSALDNLKPGDIVRYGGHSIYVTGVNGNTVTYTDCNSDKHCIIRWDATISKSTLKSSFTHVRSAPLAVSPGSVSCNCSTSYAGTYICTTSSLNLTIRSGHGSSYSAIGSIPPGATVTVSKATGTGKSDWAHVTYNGVSGYASMEYLAKKQATQTRNSKMHIWMSGSAMGESISSIRTGEWLYLCYKLYDANTGDMFDTYTTDGYTAKLTLYAPDGSVTHTATYDNDNNWIAVKRTTPGTYKGVLVFTWNSGGSSTADVSINMVYEPRVTPSESDIQLNVTGTNSKTIYISYSGATNSDSIYVNCTTEGDCFSYKWGSWTDHKMPLTVTGTCAGQGTITIRLRDYDTDEVLATAKVHITVSAPTYKVTYNANGGTGAPSAQTKNYNKTLTLSSTKPTRTGYTFLGWSTSSTATSASYQAGSSYTNNSNVTLYAVWKANTYTVSYKANGGTGAPSSQTKTHGVSLTLSSTKPTRTGYTFLGWSTSSTATSASYQAGGCYTGNSNVTLYAVWKANTYTVSYNANGGTGAPSSQAKTYGVSLTLSSTKPTRTGYTFLGWSTSSTATSATYQAGSSYTGNSNVILYAVWSSGCENGSHNYSYKVTKTPTASASGTLTGTCQRCLRTTTVTLPKLSTTDYTYKVTKSATCSADGTAKYTWKTTAYGSFSFDVKIPATEHTYTNKVTSPTCTSQGYTTHTCSCGHSYKDTYKSALGHKYSSGICSRCGLADPEAFVSGAKYVITDVTGSAGSTVEVYVSVKDNPGVISLRNKIVYDTSALQLVSVQDCGLLKGYTTPSATISSPYTLRWADSLASSDNTKDGQLVKLTFRIKDGTASGSYSISVEHTEARNVSGTKVTFGSASAKVIVSSCTLGDTDGDGEVTDWDAIVLNRYLAGWNVNADISASDVDGDGEVSDWDGVVLERYLAGWSQSL